MYQCERAGSKRVKGREAKEKLTFSPKMALAIDDMANRVLQSERWCRERNVQGKESSDVCTGLDVFFAWVPRYLGAPTWKLSLLAPRKPQEV